MNLETLASRAEVTAGDFLRQSAGDSQTDKVFRLIVQAIPHAIVLADAPGHILFMNPRAEKLFGCQHGEWIGQPVERLVPERFQAALANQAETRTGQPRDFFALRKDGAEVSVEIASDPIETPDGPLLLHVILDITERKQMEDRLRLKREHSESLLRLSRKLERALTPADILKASREELQRTLGFNTVWLYLHSVEWGFFKRFLADAETPNAHARDGELLLIEGDPLLDEIAAAEDIVVVEDARMDPRTNKATVEKLGNRTMVHVPITLAGKKRGVIGTGTFGDEGVRALTDTDRKFLSALASQLAAVIDRVMVATERQRAEAALRASEARLNFALQTSHIGAWELSLRDHTANRTPIHDLIFGYHTPLPSWTYETFLEHVLPADRAQVDGSFREATATHTDWTFECRIRRADGEVRWIWSAGGHELDAAGHAVRISGIVQDITARKQTESALRASEERLRLITNLVPHGIFAKDAEGRYLFVNRALAEGCGLSVEEILGKNDFELVADRAQAAAYRAADLAVLESGTAHFIPEEPNTNLAGRTRYLQTTKIPFTVPETGERAVMGVWVDITERRRAEEALRDSEEQFRTMVDAISQLAWIAQPDGARFWYNQRWYDYTGTTPEEMEGSGWQRVHDPEILPQVTAGWQASLATGEPFEMNFPLRAADGSFRWFLTRAFPVKDAAGAVLRWCGTNTDISKMRDAEMEIQRLNSDLERRVIERTVQLEGANKELEAFSYSVSHDLRAPLRAVDGFSQAVLEDYGGQLPEDGRRYLRTIREGAQKMGRLIDDLLTFSRLSRAPFHKEKVDVAGLVRGVLDDLSAQREGRQIDFRIAELSGCEGDASLLRQVWFNLISNALKYTRKRQDAVIEIGCHRVSEGWVYFVRDNGTGFDMRYASKLFGVFQRLHRAEDYEGTGVGLALVQRIIHRHGGRVWADAAPDRGATFSFTLGEEAEP